MQFDERVHLAVTGGGFIRTPFLTATQETPRYRSPDDCRPVGPSIIHVPAALRRSGLNLAVPTFRRAVLSSKLCEVITREDAAQMNQEGAGIAYKFHDKPHKNMARAMLSDQIRLRGEPALFLDGVQDDASPEAPIAFNGLPTAQATTGFLSFLSEAWHDLRHIDPEIMLRHHTPLHVDLDFSGAYVADGQSFGATMPVYGDVSGLQVALDGSGSASVQDDALGGKSLVLTGIPAGTTTFTLTNAAGEIFRRSVFIRDEFPTQPFVFLPAGLCGSEWSCTIPAESPYFSINPTSFKLPFGLTVNYNGFPPPGQSAYTITGTPSEYGTNFGFTASVVEPDATVSTVQFVITINRPQRDLLIISDCETADRSTGEYYAASFQPFGSCLEYAGSLWCFRRHKSMGEPWPFCERLPYAYLNSGRESAAGIEKTWRAL